MPANLNRPDELQISKPNNLQAPKPNNDLHVLLEAVYDSLAKQTLVPNFKPHKDAVIKSLGEELKKAGFSAKNLITPDKLRMVGQMIITKSLTQLINQNQKLLQRLGIDEFKFSIQHLLSPDKKLDESSLKNAFKEFLSKLNKPKNPDEKQLSEKEVDKHVASLANTLVLALRPEPPHPGGDDALTIALRNLNDGVDPRVAGGVRFATGVLKGNASGAIDPGPGSSPFSVIDDDNRLDVNQGDYTGKEARTAQHMLSNGICDSILDAFSQTIGEPHAPSPFDIRKGPKPPGTI